jgi:hypothetical protein
MVVQCSPDCDCGCLEGDCDCLSLAQVQPKAELRPGLRLIDLPERLQGLARRPSASGRPPLPLQGGKV